MSFDDNQLPESTLLLVEPYLKKPSFDPEALERKTSNSACGALCKWVIGVVRYHRMMISKVKPLHQKVEETTTAVDEAEHKMATLENKRKVKIADKILYSWTDSSLFYRKYVCVIERFNIALCLIIVPFKIKLNKVF